MASEKTLLAGIQTAKSSGNNILQLELMRQLKTERGGGQAQAAPQVAADDVSPDITAEQALASRFGLPGQGLPGINVRQALALPKAAVLESMRTVEGARANIDALIGSLAETFGFETLQKGAELARRKSLGFEKRLGQQVEKVKEEFPALGAIGQLGGQVASTFFPPGSTVPRLFGQGAAFAATRPVPEGEGGFFGKAAEIGAEGSLNVLFGKAGELAAPLIKRGADKAGAFVKSLFSEATGTPAPTRFFDEAGAPTQEAVAELQKLGISPDDLDQGVRQAVEKADLELAPSLRKEEAAALDVELTPGQTLQKLEIQQAEDIISGLTSQEGRVAREKADIQKQKLIDAGDRFIDQIGGTPDLNRIERGALIKNASQEIKDIDKKSVNELYSSAREILGPQTPIDATEILNFSDEIIERKLEGGVVDSLEKALAKFGVIGQNPVQKGRFTQVVDDQGKKINVRGEITPLTTENFEEFRQFLNQIRPSDKTGSIGSLISVFDQQVIKAADSVPVSSDKIEAFKAARKSFSDFKRRFENKNVIQDLLSFKKGSTTDKIDISRVVDSIIKSPDKNRNIRLIKDLMLKSPTKNSRAAYSNLVAETMGDIFSKAINANNKTISGAALQRGIDTLGVDNIKLLLSPEQFRDFNRLARTIKNATISLSKTKNPPETASRLFSLASTFFTAITPIPGLGAIGVLSRNLSSEIEKGLVTAKAIRAARGAEKKLLINQRNAEIAGTLLGLAGAREASMESREFLAEP